MRLRDINIIFTDCPNLIVFYSGNVLLAEEMYNRNVG